MPSLPGTIPCSVTFWGNGNNYISAHPEAVKSRYLLPCIETCEVHGGRPPFKIPIRFADSIGGSGDRSRTVRESGKRNRHRLRVGRRKDKTMWKSKLKKENEFLQRLLAVLIQRMDVCDICVFRDTIPRSCELMECRICESPEKGTSACCTCDGNDNFLWDGRDD